MDIFTAMLEGRMIYRVQVFHSESGFFLNTNHESEDLDELKALVASSIFDGVKYRIVDATSNEVQSDHEVRERKADLTIDDIARILNVPVAKRFEDVDMPGWTNPEDMSS